MHKIVILVLNYFLSDKDKYLKHLLRKLLCSLIDRGLKNRVVENFGGICQKSYVITGSFAPRLWLNQTFKH